jgi:tRNA(fMet)-specific endonuclease VapC
VIYVLDTNTIIALLKDRPTSVRAQVEARVRAQVSVYVPTIVMFELWYGVANSTRREENATRLEALSRAPFQFVGFEHEDARVAGEIRAALAAKGTPIGPYDLLIAAQALRRAATLVTANVREFGRIEGLAVEDWTFRS